ncbi:MAG: hypothetical protein R3327_04580 [Nitrosopumilaceae archaeon]|nr:hypothetical protein [Nitrosopumilaceae archaeon]
MGKLDIIIVGSMIIIAIGIFFAMILSFEQQKTVEVPTTGFPHCLRINECEGVKEFANIPQEEISVISKNYLKCLDGFYLEQTCEIRVHQDIERFFEKGEVTQR